MFSESLGLRASGLRAQPLELGVNGLGIGVQRVRFGAKDL